MKSEVKLLLNPTIFKFVLRHPIIGIKRFAKLLIIGRAPSGCESFFTHQYELLEVVDTKCECDQKQLHDYSTEICWVVLPTGPDGGGARTISRFINALDGLGFTQKIQIWSTDHFDLEAQSKIWHENFYVPFDIEIVKFNSGRDANFVFATAWQTAIPAASKQCKHRLVYLIQDDERSFEAIGDSQNLIYQGMQYFGCALTAGPWLSELATSCKIPVVSHFDFGVDPIYFPSKQLKNNQVVAYYQPGKARREAGLILAIAKRLISEDKNLEVLLVGGGEKAVFGPRLRCSGILRPHEMAQIYRESRVGIVLSATNASLVPYEMLAAGLTVLTNKGAHNEWLGRKEAIQYLDAVPAIFSHAIKDLVGHDNSMWSDMIPSWDEVILKALIDLSKMRRHESLFPHILTNKLDARNKYQF